MNKDEKLLQKRLQDREWRLNSWFLYKIKDKEGQVVSYKPNKAQQLLHKNQWYRNVILKARQMWFSTDIEIQALDFALFNKNMSVWIIAHDLDSAKNIFKDKIKFWYDNLPDWLKSQFKTSTDRTNEIQFSNGSTIRVDTSFRSWTLQFLHISEFWKICNKYPDKAKEIVTWAIEAVPSTWYVFIESTAEWNSWYFFDYSKEAQALQEQKKILSKLDYQFHFYPWWSQKEYTLWDNVDIVVEQEFENYFKKIEYKLNIKLTEWQKKWYIKKSKILWDDMWREYPSYWQEAFELAIDGAYYEKELSLMRRQNRLCQIDYNPNLDVYTSWDLWGAWWWDETAIWFFQLFGKEIRLIDYWEWSWYSMLEIINTVIKEKWYNIAVNYFPHDAKVHEYSTGKTRIQNAEEAWLKIEIVPSVSISDGINAVRLIFPNCFFDEKNTARGIKALSHYRRKFDDKNGMYQQKPLHNWASNGADSFRYLALSLNAVEGYESWDEEEIIVVNRDDLLC